MKGYLRARGYSSLKLRKKRHNLEKLHSNCVASGLMLKNRNQERDKKLIEHLNRYYQDKQFEYMELGAMLLPKLSAVSEFAEVLVKTCYSLENQHEEQTQESTKDDKAEESNNQ